MKILLLLLASLIAAPVMLWAQDPTLAPDDIEYSRGAYEKNHLIAQVDLAGRTPLHYRYDRYAEVRRIVTDDGIEYAQPKGKSWRKSKDWGKTGAIIKGDKAAELDNQADVAEVAFTKPETHDATQGGFVWRFIENGQESDIQTYTYEQSREHPRPSGVYPHYTFVKYKNDTDGKLLLYRFAGQLRSSDGVIPIHIQYGLMVIMPANSIKIVEPEKSKNK